MPVCTASCPCLCTLHTAQPTCRQQDTTGQGSICPQRHRKQGTWASRWEYLGCIAIRQNLSFHLKKRNHRSACSFWLLLLFSFIHFSEFQNTPFSSPPPCRCSPLHPPCLSTIGMTEHLPPLKKWEKSAQWDTHLGLWRPAFLPSSPSDWVTDQGHVLCSPSTSLPAKPN